MSIVKHANDGRIVRSISVSIKLYLGDSIHLRMEKQERFRNVLRTVSLYGGFDRWTEMTFRDIPDPILKEYECEEVLNHACP